MLSEPLSLAPASSRRWVLGLKNSAPLRNTPLGTTMVPPPAALALSMANLRFGERGMPFLGLELTPLHGGVLMVSGALAVLVCLGRWPTVAFAAVAAGGWAALAIVCAVRTGQHTPGVLGFDARDTVFYAVLGAYNLAVCLWLAPMVSTMWRTTRSRAS